MGSHSVTEVTFQPLPQPLLDLATPEGCKAELKDVTQTLVGTGVQVKLATHYLW